MNRIRNIIRKPILAVNWKGYMKKLRSKFILRALSILMMAAYAELTMAHDGVAVMDAAGINPGATDMAIVSCSGGTAYLEGTIEDQSRPVPGLILSYHIYRDMRMATTTDSVAGDTFAGPTIQVAGGDGNFFISATKTAAGPRMFKVIWHCKDASGGHTETVLSVVQVQ